MNVKKTNLRTDTEAVSGLIGTVLMIAILVTLYTMLQATAVPLWNRQVEKAHMPVAYDDMMTLKSDIEDVATLDVTKSSNINLGARYPDRMIFRNPGPGAYGTLTVEDDVTISIDNGTEQIFNSSRITYELYGMTPKIVYEHGILIRDYGNNVVLGPIPPENQSLYDISTGNIYIPIVNSTSFSVSSLDSKSLSIFPFTDTETDNSPPPTTITLATNYPEVWEKLTGSIDNVTVSVPDKEITIESGTIQQTIIPQIDEGDRYSGALYSGIARFYKILPSSGNGGSGGGGGSTGGVADNVTVDSGNITIGGSNDIIDNLFLTDEGIVAAALEFLRVSWEPDEAEELKVIFINTESVVDAGAQNQPSGTWILLNNNDPNHPPPKRLIEVGGTITMKLEFKAGEIINKDFTIDFLFSDGSMRTETFAT